MLIFKGLKANISYVVIFLLIVLGAVWRGGDIWDIFLFVLVACLALLGVLFLGGFIYAIAISARELIRILRQERDPGP
jgi:hypothetical protein